jgi:hypothetical protein
MYVSIIFQIFLNHCLTLVYAILKPWSNVNKSFYLSIYMYLSNYESYEVKVRTELTRVNLMLARA